MSRLMVTKIRERLGMSQKEFAEKLGVQVSTVWRWETNRAVPRAEMRALIMGLETRKRVEPAVSITTTTLGDSTVVADKYEDRQVDSYGRDVEIALLSAAGQVTAGWVSGRRFPPSAAEVADFIRMTTRALRQA